MEVTEIGKVTGSCAGYPVELPGNVSRGERRNRFSGAVGPGSPAARPINCLNEPAATPPLAAGGEWAGPLQRPEGAFSLSLGHKHVSAATAKT